MECLCNMYLVLSISPDSPESPQGTMEYGVPTVQSSGSTLHSGLSLSLKPVSISFMSLGTSHQFERSKPIYLLVFTDYFL